MLDAKNARELARISGPDARLRIDFGNSVSVEGEIRRNNQQMALAELAGKTEHPYAKFCKPVPAALSAPLPDIRLRQSIEADVERQICTQARFGMMAMHIAFSADDAQGYGRHYTEGERRDACVWMLYTLRLLGYAVCGGIKGEPSDVVYCYASIAWGDGEGA